MNVPAYLAQDISRRLASGRGELLALWKKASAEGKIRAASVSGKNFTLILDSEVALELRKLLPEVAWVTVNTESGAIVKS